MTMRRLAQGPAPSVEGCCCIGPASLSDAGLLAVFLRRGVRGLGAQINMARGVCSGTSAA